MDLKVLFVTWHTCHFERRTENEQIWRDPLACSRNQKIVALTKLTTLPTFTSSSKSRATGGEGTPIISAATCRSTKLTSSYRLVCWQPVNKATANSSPWCSWAGGTDIRLTHQGSSSWCAEVSWCRVQLFLSSLVVKLRPWREYWSPSTGRWSRGARVCLKRIIKEIKIKVSVVHGWNPVWQIGIGPRESNLSPEVN